MRIKFFLLCLLNLVLGNIHAQKAPAYDGKKDWAYLSRYRDDNSMVSIPKPNENRVVFMGNSITEGWVRMDTAFFKNNPYVGRGISGQTTPQMLLRFRQDVIDLKPKVVVISAGINDIAENTGPYSQEYTYGNIVSMIEIAKANKVKVVLASIHPAFAFPWSPSIQNVPNKVIQLNALLKLYASKNKVVYLDYHTAMKDERNGMNRQMAEDGIHPTLAGYKVMEPLVQKAIAQALLLK